MSFRFRELATGGKKEKYRSIAVYQAIHGRHAILTRLFTLEHRQKDFYNALCQAQFEGWFKEDRL